MSATIFRQNAMSRSAGPEKLDERIRVVTVRGWVGLAVGLMVVASLLGYASLGSTRVQVSGRALLVHEPYTYTAESPVYGIVAESPPQPGTQVVEGQQISAVRRADDPTAPLIPILAPASGEVISVAAGKGAIVQHGQDVAYIELRSAPLIAQAFVPTGEGKRVQPGMAATVSPSVAPAASYGMMRAVVRSVSQYSLSPDQIRTFTSNPIFANEVINGPPVLLVTLSLVRAENGSGFAWTSGNGPSFAIDTGTLGTATITISTSRPIDAVFDGNE